MKPEIQTASVSIKWFRSIRVRLFVAFSVLVFGVAVSIYLYFPAKFRDQSYNGVRDQAEGLAKVLAFTVSPALVFDDKQSAKEAIQGAKQDADVAYVLVTDKNGKRFASYGIDTTQVATYLDADFNHAFLEGADIYQSTELILHEGQPLGEVRIGHALARVNANILSSRKAILAICLGILFIGIGVVYWVSRVFTRNLNLVAATANRIGEGNFEERVSIQSEDEVGQLANAFNAMLSRLDESTRAIRAREVQYRLLAENMKEGLLQFDGNHKIRYANPRFHEMFQAEPGQVVGKNVEEVIGEGKLDIPKVLAQGIASFQRELEVEDDMLGAKYFLVSISLGNSDGEATVNAIFTDITELKKTERDLVYKNRELDTFVYKASHDLKAPLSSLKGVLNIAKEEMTEARPAKLVGMMIKTTDKMEDLLLGLLDVARIKQGALSLAPIRLHDLVQSMLKSIEGTAGYASTRIEVLISEELEWVTDAKLLDSVLQNLIFNAIKYHRDAGADKWVRVQAHMQGAVLIISVQDNGPGIPVEAQDKLFDMFFRANNNTEGTGLGLYIVKSSVEKLGGKITLKSEVGVGSEFTVRLPVLALESEPIAFVLN